MAGSMNGAVAALTYGQTIKEYTDAPVRYLVDSGIHIDSPNKKTNKTEFQNRMRSVHSLFLGGGQYPHKNCSGVNLGEEWKCLFAVELQEYVEDPIFFTQALYDGWSIAYILGYKCAEDFGSLSECTAAERENIR